MTLLFEQLLNGLQFGAMLFLLAAGLTLIFGIMGVVNLTHGSFYMVGAYCAAYAIGTTGSFLAGVLAALLGAGLYGLSVEVLVIRKLYKRDHLYQVLATFGLLLFSNEAVSLIFGRRPPLVGIPSFLEGAVTLAPGFQYPLIRLSFIAVGALVQGAIAYRSTLQQADDIFDSLLQRTALSLGTGDGLLRMGPAHAKGSATPMADDLIIQIWTPDGVRVFNSRSRRPLPDQIILGFADAEVECRCASAWRARWPGARSRRSRRRRRC